MGWFDRGRTSGDGSDADADHDTDDDDAWGIGSSGVWPYGRPDLGETDVASGMTGWERFDLIVDAQLLAVPKWPKIARRLGAADGQSGIPLGVEGEVPPAIAQVRRSAAEELSRVHDAFVVRKEWLRSEVRRMRLQRRDTEVKYLEEISAYHRSSVGASLEPRFASLDEARQADAERQAAPEPIDTRAQADLARNWFVNPVWYWLSTVVLVGAELPLSYTLADSILVETGSGWLTSAAPWMLALSITLAILVTVKLTGTLLRRAQTLLQLRRGMAGAEGAAPDTTPSPAEISSYTAAGYIRVAAAGILVIALVTTVLLLAQFRGEAFASITQQEREQGLIESQDASIDATDTAAPTDDIVPVVDAVVLGNLFRGILLLSTMSGVVLAWVSTDPEKETAPRPGRKDGQWWQFWRGQAPGDKQTHRYFVKRIDRLRGALLDADFSLARCEEALKQLDERGHIARERITTAAYVAEAEYWKANQAWRHNVMTEEFLRWLTDQLGTPPPPPETDWTWQPPKPSEDWDPEDDPEPDVSDT
jgi:hypothetical protein